MVAHSTPQHSPRRQVAYDICAKLTGDGGAYREQIVLVLAEQLGDADAATRQRAVNAIRESLADQVEMALEVYNNESIAMLALNNACISMWIAIAIRDGVAAARCP